MHDYSSMVASRTTPIGRLSKTDLHLLAVFMTVVENGGFAAAQVTLNVGQSTVSRHIGDLEKRLGMRLCQRGRVGFLNIRYHATAQRSGLDMGVVPAVRRG